jgi:7-cyano-7-deazaguanine synthase in queuosine biosynthesis
MVNRNPIKAVLMASGGLDSTVLAFWLIRRNINFVPLFVDYGQHSRKTEFQTLKKVLPADFAKQINVTLFEFRGPVVQGLYLDFTGVQAMFSIARSMPTHCPVTAL